MALAWLNIRDERDDAIEEATLTLNQPDESEAESLPHHVDKCASRFRLMVMRLNKLTRQTGRNSLLLWAILVWTVITSPVAARVFGVLHLTMGP